MKKVTLHFLVVMIFMQTYLCAAQVKEHIIPPSGIYKTIDVKRHNDVIRSLNSGNDQLRQQAVDAILGNPGYYNPPVIYALSRVLFNQGRKDEAAYWFYVGQLRARYDANLCLDVSAKQAVAVLNNEYGPDINKYAFQDMDRLERTVKKVVEFVRANDENYDHRWINLHGISAMISGMGDKDEEKKELTEPRAKWPAIKKKTIEDYYNGFLEARKTQGK
jgi:hypothetical protein